MLVGSVKSYKENTSRRSSLQSAITYRNEFINEERSDFEDADNEMSVVGSVHDLKPLDNDSFSVKSMKSQLSRPSPKIVRSSSKMSVKRQQSFTSTFSEKEQLIRERKGSSEDDKVDGNKQVAMNGKPGGILSYKTKNNIKSVLIQSEKPELIKINDIYNRNRRYDAAGKYRIGPSFITRSRLAYVDEHKPAKLSVMPDPQSKSIEFGLLTYLWTFTDQHDKQEIDLSFLQSLIDSGVNINCRDEHGQSILHAIVRDWHTDVALFAIRNNIDVDAQDKLGRSALHLAAALNCAETTKTLLMNGGKCVFDNLLNDIVKISSL